MDMVTTIKHICIKAKMQLNCSGARDPLQTFRPPPPAAHIHTPRPHRVKVLTQISHVGQNCFPLPHPHMNFHFCLYSTFRKHLLIKIYNKLYANNLNKTIKLHTY